MGCLLFTCNGRGENLYGRRHVDATALAELSEELGLRVTGFFCNGELGAPGLTKPSAELKAREDVGSAKLFRAFNREVRPMALHGFTAVFAPAPKALGAVWPRILVPAKD